MGLFSFLRKNKQEPTHGDSEFYSRAEEESAAVRGRSKRKPRKQPAESADQMLPEKKRARRRLVGAAALVLAAVIGLPMVLDSEPRPLADDITIQIPSKEQTPAPVMPPVARNASPAPAAEALDESEEIIETPPQPPAARNDGKLPAREEPARKPGQNAMPVSPGKEDDGARAAAILEGKTVARPSNATAPADGKSERIILQVAALASTEKIDELQGKLKKAGIASYTQRIATESGNRTRIRVGPFASKEEADKVRAKLAKLGLNGTVVPSNQ